MAVNIGPKIQVDGEKEYRAAMAGIIQQSKVLDSELKLLSASFRQNQSDCGSVGSSITKPGESS